MGNLKGGILYVRIGVRTVFAAGSWIGSWNGLFGLICIIALCYILGAIIRAFESRRPAPAAAQPTEQAAPAQTESIAKNGALIAAISAAIAEDMGTDVSAIRIKSIKSFKPSRLN